MFGRHLLQIAPRWAPVVSARSGVNRNYLPHVARHLLRLVLRCAPIVSARPKSGANFSYLVHVWRHLLQLAPRWAPIVSDRPTLDANCVTWLHVRRQLQQFTCACLYLDFGDSTYTRGSDFVLVCITKSWTRLIHTVDLYTKIYGLRSLPEIRRFC